MQVFALQKISVSEQLGYVGLVPFVAGGLAVTFGVEGAEEFFKFYSVMILAFMSGACWGVEQANPKDIDSIPLSLSIGAFMWAMLAYLLPINVAVVMLLVGFVLLLWVEANPLYKKSYSDSYRRLRNLLTSVVALMHVIVFLFTN